MLKMLTWSHNGSGMVRSALVSGALVLSLVASVSLAVPVGSTSGDTAVIVNGTQVTVGHMADVFVYCRANVATTNQLHHYTLHWHNSNDDKLQPWGPGHTHLFSLGTGTHVAHSYLVFHNFNALIHAGDYTCKLLNTITNTIVSSSTISVRPT